MLLIEATLQVLSLLKQDREDRGLSVDINDRSPDGDPGKFLLAGMPARVIYPRDGYYIKINKSWFDRTFQPPEISGGPFHWYVFAIERTKNSPNGSYYVCDYLTMRRFVLGFSAPRGNTHTDHTSWRGHIIILDTNRGYFEWGDERGTERKSSRLIRLRNLAELITLPPSTSDPVIEMYEWLATAANLSETEREAIIKSRIGQGSFRSSLVSYWRGCSVTGVEDPRVLRASHIKPWRHSNNLERLDVFNGLLLLPNLDVLFDLGLITFDDEGELIVSPTISQEELNILGILPGFKLRQVTADHRPYLAYHRETIFHWE